VEFTRSRIVEERSRALAVAEQGVSGGGAGHRSKALEVVDVVGEEAVVVAVEEVVVIVGEEVVIVVREEVVAVAGEKTLEK
jgi:hypothetical protein